MQRKWLPVLVLHQRRVETIDVRHVANEHDVARLGRQLLPHQVRIVVGLQSADGTELGERITGLPERFSRLTRSKFSAVPDGGRFDTARCGLLR